MCPSNNKFKQYTCMLQKGKQRMAIWPSTKSFHVTISIHRTAFYTFLLGTNNGMTPYLYFIWTISSRTRGEAIIIKPINTLTLVNVWLTVSSWKALLHCVTPSASQFLGARSTWSPDWAITYRTGSTLECEIKSAADRKVGQMFLSVCIWIIYLLAQFVFWNATNADEIYNNLCFTVPFSTYLPSW